MTIHFHHEIVRLKKKVLHVAAMVEESLRDAVRSVEERDAALAEQVINSDQEIDSLEVEVEEDCLKILALHQPVAADLRYVVAVLKINNDLERIADLAVNIAERTMSLISHNGVASPFDLSTMLNATLKMVRMSVDALVNRDTVVAHQVCREDDLIDDFHKAAYGAFKKQIKEDPQRTEYYVSLLSVSRNLERIADHATNIAEDVIYMIEGEIIRHQSVSERS